VSIRAAAVFALLTWVAACREPTGSAVLPHIEMEKVTAEVLVEETDPGAATEVHFTNGGSALWFVNTCARGVEAFLNARWTRLPPELRLCSGEGVLLPAGDEALSLADVPLGVSPGTYRYAFSLVMLDADGRAMLDEPQLEIFSTTFVVR
jgi:hypothetical protein